MTVRFDLAKLTKSVGRLPSESEEKFAGLRIGLVNNMPDGALLATEQQFSQLVSEATGGRIKLDLFYLPSLTRGEAGSQILRSRYRPVAELYRNGIDALIVTGNEPRAAKLDQEPYWHEMSALIDWARYNTASTFWSCLAAHAVVLHLDKIERQRLPAKRSGAFRCELQDKNTALPNSLVICHSRLNEVPKAGLKEAGYQIISENSTGEVDTFMKSTPSRFLFLQGHPEYSSLSLAKEYRRDVERYLNGTREDYPPMPENYFDEPATKLYARFQKDTEKHRSPDLMEAFPTPTLRNGLSSAMASSAAAIFAFWMKQIAEVRGQQVMRQA
ncbi:MAG: homoserine O-succinyltransferase [Aestuariivirga sp.]